MQISGWLRRSIHTKRTRPTRRSCGCRSAGRCALVRREVDQHTAHQEPRAPPTAHGVSASSRRQPTLSPHRLVIGFRAETEYPVNDRRAFRREVCRTDRAAPSSKPAPGPPSMAKGPGPFDSRARRSCAPAPKAPGRHRFLELIARTKNSGRLREDFVPEDLVILLMANAGVIAAAGDDAPTPGAASSATCSAPTPPPAHPIPAVPEAPRPTALYRAMVRLSRTGPSTV